ATAGLHHERLYIATQGRQGSAQGVRRALDEFLLYALRLTPLADVANRRYNLQAPIYFQRPQANLQGNLLPSFAPSQQLKARSHRPRFGKIEIVRDQRLMPVSKALWQQHT